MRREEKIVRHLASVFVVGRSGSEDEPAQADADEVFAGSVSTSFGAPRLRWVPRWTSNEIYEYLTEE